jgi:hypothetical protein
MRFLNCELLHAIEILEVLDTLLRGGEEFAALVGALQETRTGKFFEIAFDDFEI